MGAAFSAVALGWLGQALAFGLIPQALRNSVLFRGLAIWAIGLAFFILLRDPLLALFLIAALMLFLTPPLKDRVPLFLLVVPAVPVYLAPELPFPGITYLVSITHYKLAAIVLLLPVFFLGAAGKSRSGGTPLGDIALVIFAFYVATAALTAPQGAMSITNSLRVLVDISLALIVPYFAVTRAVQTEEDLDACLKALLAAAVILASIAVISTLKDWDFYRLADADTAWGLRDYRYGIQRLSITANTHSLGYLCGFALVILTYLRSKVRIGFVRYMAIFAVLTVGLIVTVSRGAMMSTVVAFAVYWIFTRKRSGQRVGGLLLAIAAMIGAGFYILAGDADTADPFATVEYRRQLLETSLQFISENLLFGDQNFPNDPRFAVLMQGQGIIDITNYYLQILLAYGVVGFGLFFLSFILLLAKCGLRLLSSAVTLEGPSAGLHRQQAIVAAGVVAWLALVATTSDVGLTYFAGVAMLSLLRASSYIAPKPSKSPAPVRHTLATAVA